MSKKEINLECMKLFSDIYRIKERLEEIGRDLKDDEAYSEYSDWKYEFERVFR